MSEIKLRRLDEYRLEIPRQGAMRVPGIIYASDRLMKAMGHDESPKQVANVAQLPGIVKASFAMPDMHWGYGFPIGGVAAFDINGGIISPGGVGYDINCGCRLMMTNLRREEIQPHLARVVNALFQHVPSGVGSKGPLKLARGEEKKVLVEGARWAVKNGYGSQGDLESMENGGCLPGADPDAVSERALERGKDQVGTLGSGNHFLEVEIVEKVFDEDVASVLGITEGQVAVMVHSGSRGLGHQVCDDYLAKLVKHIDKLGLSLPDRQLACAYIHSPEGQQYLSAMSCAANYAWANRQMLMHWAGEALEKALGLSPRALGMRLVYDVCHNIAKIEEHVVDGRKMTVCVHRKGATRAFPPGHAALPEKYRKTGQPVLIPGDMGTGSYVLVGTEKAMEETFGSTCHGAGRVLSRAAAIKASRGRSIRREMEDRGVLVMAAAKGTLAEEIPEAYKDIDEVVNVVHGAGLSRRVAKLRPVACIKG